VLYIYVYTIALTINKNYILRVCWPCLIDCQIVGFDESILPFIDQNALLNPAPAQDFKNKVMAVRAICLYLYNCTQLKLCLACLLVLLDCQSVGFDESILPFKY